MAQGLEVWETPDIVTWDELIARAFTRDRQAGRLTGRWLGAQAARLVWERIVRDDPGVQGLLVQAGIAASAWQSWCTVQDHRMALPPAGDPSAPETLAFEAWCRRYLAWLEAGGWVDPPMAQHEVHAASVGPVLELIGFERLTPAQSAALERWTGAGVEVRRAASAAAAGQVGYVRCLDANAEVDAATRWAAQLLHGKQAARVAIVISDLSRRRAAVRRLVERIVEPRAGCAGGPAPETGPYELAAARPLIEQPVVAAAVDLLALMLAGPDLAAISRFLRNPFVAGAGTEGSARARLDARIRRFEGPGLGLVALEALARGQDCPTLARQLEQARDIISKWPQKSFPSIYSEDIFRLLDSLGWPGDGLDSHEQQARERFRDLVSEFGSLDEFSGRVGRVECVGLLRELAEGTLFEPQSTDASLLIIDPATCAGMRFDAVWVCGLEASRWPAPASPDPFLARATQLRHELPRASADLSEREARETLARLCASAPRVVLSAAEIENDTPLLPSPLLAGITELAAPRGWEEPTLAESLFAGRPALEPWTDRAAAMPRQQGRRRGGARLLELQSACPFRAQAEIRLGARPLDEPGLGLDAADRGELIHEALAILWRELGSHAALLAMDEVQTRVAAARAVAEALAGPRRSADPVRRQLLELEGDWLERRVLDMLAIDRNRTTFVVEAIEQPVNARIGDLELELRPDRLDRLSDGTLAVIDYKTGAQAEVRAWLDERPRLPQLPAYVQALGTEQVGAVSFARIRAGDTRYEGLTRDPGTFPGLRVPGAKGGPRGVESWGQLLVDWRRRLESLASEFVRGDLRLAPDPPRACEFCHLGALCRIAEARPGLAFEETDEE